jgi:outer membrane protein OmpA-like peptidoglycan-associated protein
VAGRVGLDETGGLAEQVAEALVGAQVRPRPEWTLDFGLGRGLTEGYGTSRLRVLAGLTWTRAPRPPEPEPVAVVVPLVETIPDQVLIEQIALPPPGPTWKETELARVEEDQIVIRDPIQFEFAKDVILPVSLPTLRYVGGLLGEHPEILHLVIEGHASEEGSYYYNYDLAKRRADAIWRALVEAGVSPTRISTRSMGEVEPVSTGASEGELALNRRVIFQVVRRLEPGEIPPAYKLSIQQPWTGDAQVLPTPPAPPAPPAAPAPPPAEPPKPIYAPPADDLPARDSFDDEEAP